MKQLTKYIDQTLSWFLVLLMGIMVLTVTWQVTTRYLLGSPSSYTEELATYLLIWISLLGAVLALREKAHLGIDVLVNKLSASHQNLAWYFAHIAIIVFSALIFIYGGLRLVAITLQLNQLSAAFQIRVGYVYLVLPLTGVLLVYYSIYAMLQNREKGQMENSVSAMFGAE